MKFTNLSLGRRYWKRDEWPESVVVSHEGVQEEGVEYFPERTCTLVLFTEDCTMFGRPAKRKGLRCSGCGARNLSGNYCYNCGARVVKNDANQ